MLSFLATRMLRFLFITAITLVIVVALLTGLLRLGLPYASSYKNEIQTWVSDYLRAPVELGSMELGWSGFSPSLRLQELTLKHGSDRLVDISLDEIMLDLNLYKSLFAGNLQINEVTLTGADLLLEYVGGQQFRISTDILAGASGGKKPNTSLDVVAWLMDADRVALLESRIRLIDRSRDIDYQIDNLNVIAQNTGQLHQLRLSMVLPEQLGSWLQVDLDLTGSSDALAQTSGNFYATAGEMNIENWLRIWPERSIEMQGRGDVEFWGEWSDNLLLSVRGRLDGKAIQVAQTQQEDTPVALVNYPAVSADIFWQRGADGWRTEIDRFDFTYAGEDIRIRRALLAQTKDGKGDHYIVTGEGDAMPLAAVGDLLSVLDKQKPLTGLAHYARDADLGGRLEAWQMLADVQPGELPRVSLQAKLQNVRVHAVGKIPGVKNLSGELTLDDNSGQFELSSESLIADLPSVFSTPLSLEKITGSFQIDLDALTGKTAQSFADATKPPKGESTEALSAKPAGTPAQDWAELLRTKNLYVQNQGLAMMTSFSVGPDVQKQWHIDLQSFGQLEDAATASGYLPDVIMPQAATRWISEALIAGRATAGSVIVHGKLKDFPFKKNPGMFRAEVLAEEATIRFMPNWPVAKKVNGSAVFEGDGMRFIVKEGVLSGSKISRVSGAISNFRKPVLALSGANSGNLQSFVDFANNGPLRDLLSPVFERATAQGSAVLNLDLSVPLRRKENRSKDEVLSVDGSVFLKNNTVNFEKFNVALDAITGAVSFSETGLEIDNLNAQFTGAPIKIKAKTVATKSDQETQISAEGLLHADRVMSHYDIPLHSFFAGPARWQVKVALPKRIAGKVQKSAQPITLTATSDFQGTAVTLPEPMNKDSATLAPVTVKAYFDASGTQRWRVENGQAKLLLRTAPEVGLESLNIRFGQGALLAKPGKGIFIEGESKELAFDGWIKTVNQIINEIPQAEGPPSPILPVYAAVSTQNLIVGSTAMGAASYRANTDGNYINGVMDSLHLRGSIRIPRAHWDKDEAIKTRIAYADSLLLDALADESATADQAIVTPLDPRKFPRLEAHVARFVYKSLTLTNLGLRTEPDAAGMKITALGFANDDAQLIGEGAWFWADPQQLNAGIPRKQQTRLSLRLQSNDIGKTFQNSGYRKLMAEGEGSAVLELNWADAAYKPNLQTLKGTVKLYAKEGRILKIDPGAARLVGLIALQELPRRLSLDFRDLVNDGLDYNRISGSFTLGDGLAITDVLRLEGPIGVVEIQGKSDLVAETFDQEMRVLPRVSVALPIIGVLTGGASAGVGALLVAPILKALGIDIDRIGLVEYTLTGSWDEPKIDRIGQTPANFNENQN